MRSRLRTLVLVLCALVSSLAVLAPSAPVRAQQTGREDPTALRMARVRFQEGVEFFDARQYAKARAAFLQAYALKKHPTVLLNLAQSELRSGYEADAAGHFSQFLRETDGSNPGQIKEARTGLEKAKRKVAEVVLAVDVDDAYVLVDGIVQGRSPLPDPIYLPAGTHVIGVRKAGRSVTRQVTAVPGTSSTEMVNVTAPPTPAESEAPARVSSEPEPQEDVGVGRESFFHWLRRKPGGLIGAGVSVITLATTGVFIVSWQTNQNAADDTRDNILKAAAAADPPVDAPCVTRPNPSYEKACTDYKAYRDTAGFHRNVAIVTGTVAGLAIAGTITGYFIDARRGTGSGTVREHPGIAFAPSLAPGSAGIYTFGRF
jgi:hypothetical protein